VFLSSIANGIAYDGFFLPDPHHPGKFKQAHLMAFIDDHSRLVAHGASDGTVNDFGSAWSLFFRDPDGLEGEVLLPKDGATAPPA